MRDHTRTKLQGYQRDQLDAADALLRNLRPEDLENARPAFRNTLAAFVVKHGQFRDAWKRTLRLPRFSRTS